jgi:hypothetical protein
MNVGPALLQRDIDATCEPVQELARPYFDDIIIGTQRDAGSDDEALIQKHRDEVVKVLNRLKEDQWVADKSKARLFMKRVEFCGHVLGGGKRTPAPGKLGAVQHWQPPPNVSALRAFLGLCNYYASYVRMFADLAAPLQEKLKLPRELSKAGSKHKLPWTQAELEAFERLKAALVADPALYGLDPSKPYALKTDASDYAIGAALEEFPKIDGMPKIDEINPGASVAVAFMSRMSNVWERSGTQATKKRMQW